METTLLSSQLCRVFGVNSLDELTRMRVDVATQAELVNRLIGFVAEADANERRKTTAVARSGDAVAAASLEQSRDEAVEAMRATEARFATAIENSGIAVWEADLVSHETVFRSAGYHRMLGYETEELPPDKLSVANFLSPESLALVEQASLHHQRAHTESFAVEVPAKTKSGQTCWVKIQGRVTQRDADGRATRMVGTNTNVTSAREAVEAIISAKEAAESASRAKGEFLANMSHEIRTPMNGVLGLTELCLETDLSEEQRTYMELIRTSAATLITVINDILDFSKIEAGKVEIDPELISLRSILAEAVRMLAVPAHAKGLELTLAVDPSVPKQLITDGARVRQVLINLLGNAVKFTETGEVSVVVTMRDVAPGKREIRISVRDTGIGIPAEHLEKVFESFAQGEASIARRFGGTGLGLAISGRMAMLLGGSLTVESELGQGSAFSFSLPVSDAGSASGQQNTPEFAGHHALIVDDNETNGRALQALLQHWGISALRATEAEQARRMLRAARQEKREINLLVLDSQLPEGDGFSLVQSLGKDGLLPAHTLMMLTTLNLGAQLADLHRVGLDASVTKPVTEATLQDALRTLLRASAPTTRASAQSRAVQAIARGLKVLLVEDNPINQLLATRLLQKLGHEATVAENGSDAVSLFAEGSFEVVLMDLQLPTIGGLEATQLLREVDTKRGRRTPIIAMTAHALEGDRERCLAAGMDEYIAKPVAFGDLSETIQRALQRSEEMQ